MKRRIVSFILVAFLIVFASENLYAQITVSVRNQPISQILPLIEKESGYNFFYKIDLPGITNRKSISVKNKPLEEVLKQLFADTGIYYQINADKQIMLTDVKPQSAVVQTVPTLPLKQVKLIKGIITSKDGEPLIGATVYNKRTHNGVQANMDGEFQIEAATDDVLSISYVGFVPQEIKPGNQTELTVIMKENTELDEVIVVGYGIQQKKSITGSVATVQAKDIVKAPVADAANAIVGRLPGLRVVDRGGVPGTAPGTIDIRGFGSALIIVDGVQANFQQLDPNEIESISILKDASAAVYGVKAANGVIIVTTKRGNQEKPRFSFSSNFGWQKPTRFPKYVNSYQYQEMMLESEMNRTGKPNISREELENWRNGGPDYPSTDWYNEVIRDFAPQQQYNMNVRGGSESIRYFASFGYLNQGGLYKSNDTSFERYNFRTNVDTKFSNHLKASINVSGRKEDRKSPYEDLAFVMGGLIRNHPMYTPYVNGNKEYPAVTNQSLQNPAVLTNSDLSGYKKAETKVFELRGEIQYDAPFLKGLTAKASYYYRTSNTWDKNLRKQYTLYKYDPESEKTVNSGTAIPKTYLYEKMSAATATVGQTTVEYKNTFADKHDFTLLYVGEYTKRWNNNVNGSKDYTIGFAELDFGDETGQKVGGLGGESATIGHVGRLNYAYDNKYLIEMSFRYDGNSTYPRNKRWGFFPGASLAWRVTEEAFMQNLTSVLTDFKLRASIARLGDDLEMDAYSDLTGYNYPGKNTDGNIVNYIFSEDLFLYNSISPKGIPNPDLTWLQSTTTNIGFDFTLFRGLISGEFDVFYRKREGKKATREKSLPTIFGEKLPQENLNSDSHRGFEVILRHQRNTSGGLFYSIAGNMSYTRGKYEYLEQALASNSYQNWRINDQYRWMNKRFGYKSAGQFQSYDEIAGWAIQDNNGNNTLHPGDIKYVDINKDGVIDDNDQTIIGRNNVPEIIFGLDISANYKNFDFSVFFQGAANYHANFTEEAQNPFFNNASSLAIFADRWHREDPFDLDSRWIKGKYPSTYAGGKDNNKRLSDFWLQDASYIRLKNIQLGYTLPKSLLSKFNIETLRFYVSAFNILTLTKLDIYDPEAPSGRGLYYPQQKSYNVGFNLTF